MLIVEEVKMYEVLKEEIRRKCVPAGAVIDEDTKKTS